MKMGRTGKGEPAGARIAVIGACGATGRAHLAACRAAGARVAVLADIDAGVTALARKVGAVPVRDWRRIGPDDADAAIISLPPRLHPPVASLLLRRGIHVLCEKPVAVGTREGEDLRKAARSSGATFLPVFQLRFDAGFARLRNEIARGSLGRVLSVRVDKLHEVPLSGRAWRLSKGGGVTLIKDIHYYDLIPWILGSDPDSVWARGGDPFHRRGVDDFAEVMMEFRNGAVLHLRSGWWPFQGPVLWKVEVVGTRGFAEYDGISLRLHLRGRPPRRVPLPRTEDPMTRQMRAFLHSIDSSRPALPGVEEGLRPVRVCEAVLRSMRTGRIVPVRD